MNALDRLLLEAKTAALHHEIVVYRQTAARDADLLPRIDRQAHGAGKAMASDGLRMLMRSLERFGGPEARKLLAEAIAAAADAIRTEPDRPGVKTEPDYFWMRESA